jgi:hypothetical protein
MLMLRVPAEVAVMVDELVAVLDAEPLETQADLAYE